MKALVLFALLLALGGQACAQDALARAKTGSPSHAKPPVAASQRSPQNARVAALAPLPATVPEQFSPPQEAYASFPQADTATPNKPSACQLRLAKVATFKSVSVLIRAGECGAVDAVILDGVILSDRAKVAISPPATLRCAMAEEVAAWLRDDIAPAVLKLGAALRGLDNFDSYECRGRNRVRGATLSEHGRANALDVRAFKLASGEEIGLTDVSVGKAWRDGIPATACARSQRCSVLAPMATTKTTFTSISRSVAAATGSANGRCASRLHSPIRKSGRFNRQLPHRRCRSRCRCRARGRSPPIPGATCNCVPRPARNDAALACRALRFSQAKDSSN